jgi:hypothetical protein
MLINNRKKEDLTLRNNELTIKYEASTEGNVPFLCNRLVIRQKC